MQGGTPPGFAHPIARIACVDEKNYVTDVLVKLKMLPYMETSGHYSYTESNKRARDVKAPKSAFQCPET